MPKLLIPPRSSPTTNFTPNLLALKNFLMLLKRMQKATLILNLNEMNPKMHYLTRSPPLHQDLPKQVTELEATLAALNDTVQSPELKSMIDSLQSQIQEKKDGNKTVEEKNTELKTHKDQFGDELDSLEDVPDFHEILERSIKELQDEEIAHRNDALEAQIVVMESELNNATNDNERPLRINLLSNSSSFSMKMTFSRASKQISSKVKNDSASRMM